MLVIVSDMAIDLLMYALTDTIRGVLTNVDIEVLVDVNVNVLADLITAFNFAMPGPLEVFCC